MKRYWLPHLPEARGGSGKRLNFVCAVVLLVALSVVGRASFLQVIEKDHLQKEGNGRVQRTLEIPALRGLIYDRNGEALAVSSPMVSLWINPQILIQYRDYLPQLAEALNMPAQELIDFVQAKADVVLTSKDGKREIRLQDVWLKRQLPPDEADKALRLNIPGLAARREYRRFYPDAEVTSHLLGFTDLEDKGQSGLEKTYDDWLTGSSGAKRVVKDLANRVVDDLGVTREAEQGKPLHLSIDRRLQYIAYRALKAAVVEHNAVGGSLVLANARTGEILAMVNQPAGNPNDRAQRKPELMKNRAMTDVFEPGSTIKPFVVAAGLNTGKWKPTTVIETSPGYMQVGRNTVRDTHNYGTMDVTKVITKSSNIGVTKIAFSMPPKELWDMYHNVGFGQASEIQFWAKQKGYLGNYKNWKSPFEYATKTFGYGITSSTLELTQAYAVFANHGVYTPLTLTKRLPSEQPTGEQVMSPDVAQAMIHMMETVVAKGGSGLRASVPGFRVAGKSGTSRKVVNGGYAGNKHRGLFAGVAPATDPQFVLVVMIDEPSNGQYYGGLVAAPVFSQVMGSTLRLMGVEPDNTPNLPKLELVTTQKNKP